MCSAFGVAVAGLTAVATTGAQQPDVSLSPFVTFLPTGSAGPMTGLALAFADGPLALRGSGYISVQDRSSVATTSAVTTRPWGADADAIAFLESMSYRERIAVTPYVFLGVSTSAVDSAAFRLTRQGWSYGGGAMLPLGAALGLFGEWRWRMSRFVMPNATNAPPVATEIRIGATFHVGHGGETGRAVPIVVSGEQLSSSESSLPGSSALRVLSTADEYVGTPYRRGGTSPQSGFDASGFVRFIFSRFGVMLPRTSRDQARVGDRVRTDWHVIQPGDLLMFQDDGGINHVAIYVGKNRIIHSSETGGGVRYDDLSTDRGRWFMDHLVAARRVTPDLRGLLLDLARGYPTDVSRDSDGPDHAPRTSMRSRR
jgi:cell wall-associated NlpC family hydrolase